MVGKHYPVVKHLIDFFRTFRFLMGVFSVIPRKIEGKILRLTLLLLTFLNCARADEIAYFYALDADLQTLKEAGSLVGKPASIASQVVTTIRIGDHTVRAVKMGTGSVQTAAAAATLLARFAFDFAISTGPAGRLSDTLSIGEWTCVQQVIAFQDGSETPSGFSLSKNASHEIHGPSQASAFTPSKTMTTISIASGNLFIASDLFREQLHQLTSAAAVDMNLAGLVIACENVKVPLICWKIISDSAGNHAPEEFSKFLSQYDGSGGKMIADYVGGLPMNPNRPTSHPNLLKLLDQKSPK